MTAATRYIILRFRTPCAPTATPLTPGACAERRTASKQAALGGYGRGNCTFVVAICASRVTPDVRRMPTLTPREHFATRDNASTNSGRLAVLTPHPRYAHSPRFQREGVTE